MSCRTGCKTNDHASWGDCYRAAGIQIDRHGLAGHRDLERRKDTRLTAYESARRSGLQPRNTSWPAINDALENGGVGKTPSLT